MTSSVRYQSLSFIRVNIRDDSYKDECSLIPHALTQAKRKRGHLLRFNPKEKMQSLLRSTQVLPRLSSCLVSNTIRMSSNSTISAVIKNDHANIKKAYEVC